eukprot:240442-Rhodomonas_salina.2
MEEDLEIAADQQKHDICIVLQSFFSPVLGHWWVTEISHTKTGYPGTPGYTRGQQNEVATTTAVSGTTGK